MYIHSVRNRVLYIARFDQSQCTELLLCSVEAAAANLARALQQAVDVEGKLSIAPELMARVVLVAALVLYAAVAVAHATRVLEYEPANARFGEGPTGQLAAEAVSPSSAQHVAPPAVPGGGRDQEGGSAIADILWFVLRWANEAPAGDRRKDY